MMFTIVVRHIETFAHHSLNSVEWYCLKLAAFHYSISLFVLNADNLPTKVTKSSSLEYVINRL